MGRFKKTRCCRLLENEILYKPISIPMQDLETIEIEQDEFEALRLCDVDEMNQIEASEQMQVSRGTVQRLLLSGRKKIISALLENKAIKIK